MSLFDRQLERVPERKLKKSTLKKPKKAEEPKRASAKTERRKITEAWERGELKFDYLPDTLKVCTCNQAPEYHQFPHAWHEGDMDLFNYHRRLRYDYKTGKSKLYRAVAERGRV